MKRIVTTLATLALAVSLAAPAFAATGKPGAKGQTPTQSATAKPKAKTAKVKKPTKAGHKAAAKSAKTTPAKSN